jgi:hypothetical protein
MSDLQTMNGIASLLCALVLSAVVLSDRVKDGVVIKAGLIAMIGSFIVTAMLTFENSRDWQAYAHAHLINRVGLLIACGGALWRYRIFVNRAKKKSDAHSPRTNQLLSGMTGPASDLMDLFVDSQPQKETHDARKAKT